MVDITGHVAEVKSFSVHLAHHRLQGTLVNRRTITLHFKPNGEPLRHAYLHFLDGAQGKEGKSAGATLFIDLPAEAYEDWLHLLQTEAPLHFSWTVDEDTGEVLGAALYSGEEPPGEGYVDLTP